MRYATICPVCGVSAVAPCPACRGSKTPEYRFKQRVTKGKGKTCRCSDVIALIDRYGSEAGSKIEQLSEYLARKTALPLIEARQAIERYIHEKSDLA